MMTRFAVRCCGIALGLATAGVATAQTPAAGGGSVLVQGAAVFDGERMIGTRDVLVSDGRIARIEPRIEPPAGTPLVDGRGKTLIPGLLDAHVHVFPTAAADALRFGVTTAFDMFTFASPEMVAERRAAREGSAMRDEADVWSAGLGVTPPGGHPSQIVRQMGATMPMLAPDADAAAFVATQIAAGSDYIKIFQEELHDAQGQPQLPRFARAQLGAIIDAAHAGDRKTIVHVSRADDAREVFELGGDALAHMFADRPAEPALVRLAAERRVVMIPTLSVLAGIAGDDISGQLTADPAIAPHLSEPQRGMLAARFPTRKADALTNALESVRRFHAAGVTILAGTDAPNPGTAHGPSIHGELELLVRAGLTPTQALTAATAAPADFFGTADRGRIAVGKRADLLLVEGDPTADITATRRIAGIWRNGHRVDRARMPVMPPRPAAAPARAANR